MSSKIEEWLDGQAWQLLVEYIRDIECTDICDYNVSNIEFKARAVEYLDDYYVDFEEYKNLDGLFDEYRTSAIKKIHE